MLKTSVFIAVALLGFAAPRRAAADPPITISIAPSVQAELGVGTARLAPARRATDVDAFAKVLDPEPLTQLISDIETAQAAASASAAEATRARVLHQAGGGVSAKDMESAVAQARQDALKAAFLRQRIGLEWGPGVARMSEVGRRALAAALVKGEAALVHVDTHNNAGQSGARFVKIDIGAATLRGVVIGPARAAEPRLQSSGLLVKVIGHSAILLSVGLTQSAHIEQPLRRTGVVAPRAAVIRFRGDDWVYIRAGPSRFERRLLQSPSPGADGLFVSEGLAAGDEVVVRGAGALFATEQAMARPPG